MSKLQSALDLVRDGLWVFLLRVNEKKPAHEGWQEEVTRDDVKIRQLFGGGTDFNIGVSTDRFGDGTGALVVIDVDNKNGVNGDATIRTLELEGKVFPLTREHRTPTGGRHLVYRVPKAMKQGAHVFGPGIDVRSRGGYIVGPGSTIDGETYTCINPDQPIAELPAWALDFLLARDKGDQRSGVDAGAVDIDQDRAERRAREWLEKHAPTGTQGSRNETGYRVAARLKDYGVARARMLPLMMQWKCEPSLDAAELEHVINSVWEYTKDTAGNAAPEAAFTGARALPSLVMRAENWQTTADLKDAATEIAILWRDNRPEFHKLEGKLIEKRLASPRSLARVITEHLPELDRHPKSNKALANLRNVKFALQEPYICGASMSFDLFRQERAICWEGGEPQNFRDADAIDMRERLESDLGFPSISAQMMSDALTSVDRLRSLDSAQAWLAELTWDKKRRIERFCADYLKTADTEYAKGVGLYAWSAHAGRILSPGIQADMIPVLVGDQGAGKSSAIKAIAPAAEQYCEINLTAKDDDLARLMIARLVGEISELSGLSARDAASLKSWVTRREERWVPKYQESATSYPRRIVIWGTTNDETFLTDPTGERRWLPIRVGKIDVAAIERDRDQLWAEAAVRFKADGILWRDAERLAPAYHEQHKVEDPWSDAIVAWLRYVTGPVTTARALQEGVRLPLANQNKSHEMRMGKVLRRLGYKPGQERVAGEPDANGKMQSRNVNVWKPAA